MSKTIKISIILTIILNLFIVISNAETTNIYNDVVKEESEISDNTTTNNTSNDTDDFDLFDNNVAQTTTSNYYTPNYSTNVSTMSSISEANLGLNNILCIILIAIGILIILLAIAILIKLKNIK